MYLVINILSLAQQEVGGKMHMQKAISLFYRNISILTQTSDRSLHIIRNINSAS